ncbi:MAG: aminoacetone oxidase family FAD-binding enzyme [Chlamydiales bacterium]|nr:aminoacetone oxidase family FAD-binding enzyme [Chlamydiales bacterium]
MVLKDRYSVIIIGAGAAGIFAANQILEKAPHIDVLVIEQSAKALSKVKISGGGRCNVTHQCFTPKDLVKNYPRGSKELLGPFYNFQPENTIEWFKSKGVSLKAEADGRMFPITDSSQTIIDALMKPMTEERVLYKAKVERISKEKDAPFHIELSKDRKVNCQKLMLATGSSAQVHRIVESLGHSITDIAPSLFTFNIPSSSVLELSGLSVKDAEVSIPKLKLKQRGPLLITHWGFSGPSILKLSAWGARALQKLSYNFSCKVDWLPDINEQHLRDEIRNRSQVRSKKAIINAVIDPKIPKNLWKSFVTQASIKEDATWYQLPIKSQEKLLQLLKHNIYTVEGKSTFKQEFVTCGGIKLSEINFKTMESKLEKGLFFGGELLDIDGITGGFNFQAAWTTAFLAAQAIVDSLE